MTDIYFLDADAIHQSLEEFIQKGLPIITCTSALDVYEKKYSDDLRRLREYPHADIIITKHSWLDDFNYLTGIGEDSPEMLTLASAFWFEENVRPDETIFVSGSLSLCNKANLVFGEDSIIWTKDDNWRL